MIGHYIAFFLGNFSLVMLVLALVISVITRLFSSYTMAETIFRWVALLALGCTGVYSFIMHAFFSAFTAATIGWAPSPFQFEVAMADLSAGMLGIFAFNASIGFRTATVLTAIILFWGDAIGHIRQMIVNHNFAPGNAGSWFWMDILIPLILLVTLCKLRRSMIQHT